VVIFHTPGTLPPEEEPLSCEKCCSSASHLKPTIGHCSEPVQCFTSLHRIFPRKSFFDIVVTSASPFPSYFYAQLECVHPLGCFISEIAERISVKFRIGICIKNCRANLILVPSAQYEIIFLCRSN
jgi:hypothetical protein